MKQNVNYESLLFHEREKRIGKMPILRVRWKSLHRWSAVTVFAHEFSWFTEAKFSLKFQDGEDN